MSKTLRIAWREFLSTAATKGFIIGLLVVPAMLGVMVLIIPWMVNAKPPKVAGEVAVVDPTGRVTPAVREYLSLEEMARRRGELTTEAKAQLPKGLADRPEVGGAVDKALEDALGGLPELEVVELRADVDVEQEKVPLREGTAADGGRLALAVVDPDAVEPGEGGYGDYDLFVKEKLDDRIEDEIRDALREAIVEERVEAAGLDREQIEAVTRVRRVRSTTVTEEGERETNEVLNLLLPAGFMILLLVSVMSGGQYILTTTVEEKSSRVVEVLLSAVSPMQLMTGKIIGQLLVGFLILALYAGMGILALVTFAMSGLVDPWLFVYLLIFYLIAYFTLASLMAAIGAAVNEMREAQSLMTPVMLVMIVPWLLWMPISRDPNSVLAVVMSYIPPLNSFVMMLRMTSTSPPPLWEVWLSILVGILGVWAAIWFAAKVFRIGLLMFGKPPDLKTLARWVRMA
jgi:ABC-2 type transport system permease protein